MRRISLLTYIVSSIGCAAHAVPHAAPTPPRPISALSWDQSKSVFERRVLPPESITPLPWDERIGQLLIEQSGDVVLTAVGDVIANRKASELPEPDHRNLFRLLREADIAFANLEMSINRQKSPDDAMYDFGVSPEFVWEMANLGINLVSLANNHTMDFGGPGLADCLKALDMADIAHAGAGMTLSDARKPGGTRVQSQSTHFGLLSYVRHWSALHTDNPEGPARATIDPAIIAIERPGGVVEEIEGLQQSELAAMQDDVVLAKRHHQFVIVSIHAHDASHSRAYGFPHRVPDNDLIMYHQAVNAGADVVLAHGPHVLRGIEIYKGKPIFFSLGNFIYQYRRPDKAPIDIVHQRNVELERPTNVSVYDRRDSIQEMESIVVRLTLNQERVRRIEIIPVTIDREGPEFGTPRLANDQRGSQILERVQQLSVPFRTTLSRKGWYAEVELPAEARP